MARLTDLLISHCKFETINTWPLTEPLFDQQQRIYTGYLDGAKR